MQKKHLIFNFLIILAALITCAIAGEFYLSTLLLMLPVYYIAYAIYLALNYRKHPYRNTYNKKLFLLPFISFLIYLVAFAASFTFYRQIERTVATEIEKIPVCAVDEDCSEAVVLTYRQILEKRFFLTRDNRCVRLRSPGYALVKTELEYCLPDNRKENP